MKKMFILLSHELSQIQKNQAISEFGIKEFVNLPLDLQERFSNIPPEFTNLDEISKSFKEFLLKNASSGDFAVIAGDFGLTYILVNFCKTIGITPVYATTKRIVKEEIQNDKIVKKSIFEHIKFREFK